MEGKSPAHPQSCLISTEPSLGSGRSLGGSPAGKTSGKLTAPPNPVSFPCRAGCRPRGLHRGLTPGPCPLLQGISSETPYRTQTCTSWPGSCTTGRMRSAHSCWQESIRSAGRVGGAMEALLQPFCDVHSSWGSLRTWAPPLWVEGTPSQRSPSSRWSMRTMLVCTSGKAGGMAALSPLCP